MSKNATGMNRYPAIVRWLLTLILTAACVFTFAVSARADQTNTSLSTAAALTPGDTVNVTFTDHGMADYYYQFTMTKGGEFNITNVCTSSDDDITASVVILNSAQEVVADTTDEEVMISLAKGTYYLKISRVYYNSGDFTIGTSVSYAKDAADNRAYSSAAEFTPGTSFESNIGRDSADYADLYYKFTMEKGGVVDFSLISDNIDFAGFYFVNAQEENVCHITYKKSGRVSLAKGTYYLLIFEEVGGGEGNYTLKTTVDYADTALDNHALSSALEFTVGSPFEGNLGLSDSCYPDDVYQFTMDKGGVFHYSLKSDTIDFAGFRMLNAEEEEVYHATLDKSGSVSLTKGKYYLIISEEVGGGDGNFTLETSADYAADAGDNHDESTALTITPGKSYTDNLGLGLDGTCYEDCAYKFTLSARAILGFSIKGDNIGFAGFVIEDANKKEVESWSYETSGSLSLEKGTYYLIIHEEVGGGDGNFTLSTNVNYSLLDTPVLKSVANSTTGVTVAWNAVEGAENYKVFCKTASGKWTAAGITTGTSYTVTGLTSGTAYAFTVRCMSGDSKVYTSAYDTTGKSIQYVAAPVVSCANASNGVKVSWKAVTGAGKYRVFRKVSGAASWSRLADVTTAYYVDKTVKSGTTYVYTVRCMNAAVSSYVSDYNRTGKSILFLSAPTTTVKKVSGKVQVNWTKVTGARGYYVYRKTASGSWTRVATITSGSTIRYTDSKAVKNTKYYYAVKAYSGNTYGAYIASKVMALI